MSQPPINQDYACVKTPTLFQMEIAECGAAALGIILGYYGRYIPLEQLREECGISRDGCKAINVVRAAEKEGLTAQGYRRSIPYLYETKTPFIVFWEYNHFIVVEGFKGDRVYVNDPAMGRRECSIEEFAKGYSGVVLCFEKTPEFKKKGSPSSIVLQLLKRLKGEHQNLLYIFYFVLASTILGLITPIFGKLFVDYYLIENMHSIMKVILLGVAATTILRFAISWLLSYYTVKFQNKLTIKFSSSFLWKLLQMPYSFFSHRYVGDIAQRVELNRSVASFASTSILELSTNILLVILFFLLMIYLDLTIAAITIVMVVINGYFLYLVSKIRRDLSFKMSNKVSLYYGYGYGALRNIESLKASGAEQDAFSRVAGSEVDVANTIHILDRKSLAYFLTPMVINNINTILVLILGALKVMSGDMTIGTLVALQSIVAGFVGPIAQICMLATHVQEMAGSIAKLDDVNNYIDTGRVVKEDTQLQKPLNHEDSGKLAGKIEVKNLTFGYNRLEKPILHNVSFEVFPGEHIAIVGLSGSGKSTLTKLLVNLYDPWEGEILFDQKKPSAIHRVVFQNSLSLVEQKGYLFNCKIRENITLWDDNVPLKRIIKVCKETGIHDEISLRPHGYDEIVMENGGNFSGGQRQRLELSRALLNDPSILILDEATSELDVKSEYQIYDFLRKRGCTTVIAAHRLSTVQNADRIIVLKSGKIIGNDTHAVLLKTCEYYKNLMSME